MADDMLKVYHDLSYRQGDARLRYARGRPSLRADARP
jgi:hypothetical protein